MLFALLCPVASQAAEGAAQTLDLTHDWVGYAGLAVFSLAYGLVILEEKIHLRKSKPVLLAELDAGTSNRVGWS
jgi:hypothetical protein